MEASGYPSSSNRSPVPMSRVQMVMHQRTYNPQHIREVPALIVFLPQKMIYGSLFVNLYSVHGSLEFGSSKKLLLLRSLMCGYWAMDGEVVLAIIGNAYSYNLPCLPKWSELIPPWENATAIGMAQVDLMYYLGVCKDEWLIDRDSRAQDGQCDLLGILERSRHARSIDPRDRVFAFINLCKERHEPDLQPDYTKAVAETFKRIAKFFVRTGQGAKLLRNSFLSDSNLDLPSWVPDWSLNSLPFEKIAPKTTRVVGKGLFAAGGEESDIQLNGTFNELQVTVYGIDRITHLGQIYNYRDDPPLRVSPTLR